MVVITTRRQFPICAQCQLKEINQPIEDPSYKKFFEIDQNLYEQSGFLRSIKSNYLRYGSLTDKQKEAFKKVVDELRKGAAETTSKKIEEK